MSPQSPANCETPARSSLSKDQSLAPRLKSLEAQAQVQATEIALLRQLGEDLGSWRYRVDSASSQTAHVLQALNRDLDALKERVDKLQEGAVAATAAAAGKSAVEELVAQMRDCYSDLQCALTKLRSSDGNPDLETSDADSGSAGAGSANDGSSSFGSAAEAFGTDSRKRDEFIGMQDRLYDIEKQIATAQALASEQANEIELLERNGVQVAAEARTALLDAASAAEAAEAATSEVHALRLGLEVVEQGLEDLDSTDALNGLRSRVDDLDSGVERTSQQLIEVANGLANLRATVDAAMTAAAAAEARARCAEADAAALRKEVKAAGAPVNSAPPSPVPMAIGDSKVKAAVHTLSDGYRSLHRAMVLMYEEQAEVAERVGAVGSAAATAQADKERKCGKLMRHDAMETRARKIREAQSDGVISHPLVIHIESEPSEDRALPPFKTEQEYLTQNVEELRALLAAQAAYISSQTRRTDALEDEIRTMRLLLASLAPSTPPETNTKGGPASSDIGVEQDSRSAVEQVNVTPTKAPTLRSLAGYGDEEVAVFFRCTGIEEERVRVSMEMTPSGSNKGTRQEEEEKDNEWKISTVL